jgi:lipoate---protein ligase
MIRKDISFLSGLANLYFDDVLLELAEAGQSGEVLRFWESPYYFIVLGRTSKEQDDVIMNKAHEDNIPIFRRSSGGGTVLQGPGCLNFSLILSIQEHNAHLQTIHESYRYILNKITKALKTLNIDSSIYLPSDIALTCNQKKVSGNAQKRSKHFILHHGTLLYAFDLSMIERYLSFPKIRPDYRRERKHIEFVTNFSVDVGPLKNKIAEQFVAVQVDQTLTSSEKHRLRFFMQRSNTFLNTIV